MLDPTDHAAHERDVPVKVPRGMADDGVELGAAPRVGRHIARHSNHCIAVDGPHGRASLIFWSPGKWPSLVDLDPRCVGVALMPALRRDCCARRPNRNLSQPVPLACKLGYHCDYI